MKPCIICGELSEKPIRSAFSHFYLYAPGNWQYLRGNMKMFGRWSGFWSTLYLACPALNTIRHWKYRKAKLVIRS